jgi:hypothetical protein
MLLFLVTRTASFATSVAANQPVGRPDSGWSHCPNQQPH